MRGCSGLVHYRVGQYPTAIESLMYSKQLKVAGPNIPKLRLWGKDQKILEELQVKIHQFYGSGETVLSVVKGALKWLIVQLWLHQMLWTHQVDMGDHHSCVYHWPHRPNFPLQDLEPIATLHMEPNLWIQQMRPVLQLWMRPGCSAFNCGCATLAAPLSHSNSP